MEETNIEIESPTEKNVASQLEEGNTSSKGKKRFYAKSNFHNKIRTLTTMKNYIYSFFNYL